ncbi:unnamed protein product [Peniophora sp. CBMAI 1063]|nr:unnamed protein product [Peniophora sp. CBMAI 1063]
MPSPGLATTAQKPLPSTPNDEATRAGSFRRIFRRRFSEPGRRPQIHNDWTLTAPPMKGSAHVSARLGTDDNERWRDSESIAALTLVPEDGPQDEEILPTPETPARVRSLRRRPPISVLDQISSIIPEASPMLTVPTHKRRQLQEDSDELNIRSGGLHLSFPVSESGDLPPKTPTSRLRRLSRTIARAVADAGMISPRAKSDGNRDASPAPEGRSLYKGTYGQVRNALHAAGLVVKKCEEEGFDGGQYLTILHRTTRS